MVSAMTPAAGPRSPVPSKASTMAWADAMLGQATSNEAPSFTSVIFPEHFSQRERFSAASPRNSFGDPKRKTSGSRSTPNLSSFKRRAATIPSPPLLPFPQRKATGLLAFPLRFRLPLLASGFPPPSFHCHLGIPPLPPLTPPAHLT